MTVKNPRERTPEYYRDPTLVDRIYEGFRVGLPVAQVAELINVGTSTLHRWISKDEVIKARVREAKTAFYLDNLERLLREKKRTTALGEDMRKVTNSGLKSDQIVLAACSYSALKQVRRLINQEIDRRREIKVSERRVYES